MSLVCKIAGHKWHKTADGKEGCSCVRCGERNWGAEHNWQKAPGSCESTCAWCGTRDVLHEWNGCTCTWCGEVRDLGHDWRQVPGTCDYVCSICGQTSEHMKSHQWEGYTCVRCGAVRNEEHDFVTAPHGSGRTVCSVCGMDADVSRAKAAGEMLELMHRRHCKREEEQPLTQKAYALIRQIGDPAQIMTVAPLAPYCAAERLAELGGRRGAGDHRALRRGHVQPQREVPGEGADPERGPARQRQRPQDRDGSRLVRL
ncbi:DUF1660 family phage protein [Slackia heliotrinireducens]|uniref:DUF1660 family phage protein n=1 Tax=Slackia heliotrinireducens TaxID=84110 RepID=UPI003315BC4A